MAWQHLGCCWDGSVPPWVPWLDGCMSVEREAKFHPIPDACPQARKTPAPLVRLASRGPESKWEVVPGGSVGSPAGAGAGISGALPCPPEEESVRAAGTKMRGPILEAASGTRRTDEGAQSNNYFGRLDLDGRCYFCCCRDGGVGVGGGGGGYIDTVPSSLIGDCADGGASTQQRVPTSCLHGLVSGLEVGYSATGGR